MAGKGKHNEIDLEKLELLAETGMSEENIARCMDIKYPTFRLWKKKNPNIDITLKKGKSKPMDKVVNSLHRSATGYYYSEYKSIYDPNSEDKKIKMVEKTVKWSKPSDTAGIYLTKVILDWHDGQFAPKPITKEVLIETLEEMENKTKTNNA